MIEVHQVGAERAAEVLAVIKAGFGAREVLDPPSTATEETHDSVSAALAEHGGLLATSELGPVGTMLLEPTGEMLGLRRVAVHPDAQARGVAGLMVRQAERIAADRRLEGLRLAARVELPRTVRFWKHLGYVQVDEEGPLLTMAKLLPIEITLTSPEETRDVGRRLAGVLRAGDLLILSGDLGAGKTTLTQGIGAGLAVRGDVTSPTFVISRVHPPLGPGPALVHVDAYRLGGIEELDDLDLDTSLDEAVTVVEWGEGVAEGLADTRLEVHLTRSRGGEDGEPVDTEDHDPRTLRVTPVGARWIGAGLRKALQ
jgi:tRNA threonylcarbamoyladenosine biosynthesis protein TsaE